MPKSSLDIYSLIEKYLISIGVSKTFVKLQLIPSKYESPVYHLSQKKSNIVRDNKQKTTSKETHIAIAKNSWYMFFKDSEINGYEFNGNTRESTQNFLFFEANLFNLLERRISCVSKSKFLKAVTPSRIYSSSSNLLSGNACKWIDSNNNFTQVRLSKSRIDSDIFSDFRLGIQINDYLIFMKNRFSDTILTIVIPIEYINKYNIIEPHRKKNKEKSEQEKIERIADSNYISESEDDGVEEETPLVPKPAPNPKMGKKAQPKYVAKPSIGRGAIKKASYICENDSSHITFIARRNGNNFMEPHHLIPLSAQHLFEHDIDITANIICLCPNCHSKIHYGTKEEIKDLLRKFLTLRSRDLSDCGLPMDETTLFALYEL